MKNNISPVIRPIDEITYEFPQSNYEVAPKVPFRAIITGPSGSGKSVLLTNMVKGSLVANFRYTNFWVA